MITSATNTSSTGSSLAAAGNAFSQTPAEAQERFLKLMVAQLENQDPLNPMDNAQLTSQMAQINTVSGIQQVNETLKGLVGQFSALQSMQGVSLVGREIVAEGNAMSFDGGEGQGAFTLESAADSVRVDVVGRGGQLLDSVAMGSLSAGMHDFTWSAGSVDPALVGGIRVVAQRDGAAVLATPLARQRVESVGMVDGAMRLRTEGGQTLSYDDVLAFM